MGGPVSFVRSEVDVRFIGENPWTCVGYDPLCDPYHRGGSLLQRVCELHPGVENLPPSLVDRAHPRAENLPPTVQSLPRGVWNLPACVYSLPLDVLNLRPGESEPPLDV